jgi:hypothetical protein
VNLNVDLPLIEGKRRLTAVMPKINSRLLYVDHIEERGVDLFRAARASTIWKESPGNGSEVATGAMAPGPPG